MANIPREVIHDGEYQFKLGILDYLEPPGACIQHLAAQISRVNIRVEHLVRKQLSGYATRSRYVRSGRDGGPGG